VTLGREVGLMARRYFRHAMFVAAATNCTACGLDGRAIPDSGCCGFPKRREIGDTKRLCLRS
jgi:hypothetical protein